MISQQRFMTSRRSGQSMSPHASSASWQAKSLSEIVQGKPGALEVEEARPLEVSTKDGLCLRSLGVPERVLMRRER